VRAQRGQSVVKVSCEAGTRGKDRAGLGDKIIRDKKAGG